MTSAIEPLPATIYQRLFHTPCFLAAGCKTPLLHLAHITSRIDYCPIILKVSIANAMQIVEAFDQKMGGQNPKNLFVQLKIQLHLYPLSQQTRVINVAI